MALSKHFTTQDSVAFVHNVFTSIEESKHDLDLSIVLDTDNAMYLYELLGYSETLIMKFSEIDNDFGEISGKCLLTVFKTGNHIDVVVEDVFQQRSGEKSIKYHEASLLVVAKEDIQLVQKYVVNKVVVVDFVCEKEIVKALLFD